MIVGTDKVADNIIVILLNLSQLWLQAANYGFKLINWKGWMSVHLIFYHLKWISWKYGSTHSAKTIKQIHKLQKKNGSTHYSTILEMNELNDNLLKYFLYLNFLIRLTMCYHLKLVLRNNVRQELFTIFWYSSKT